MDCRIEGAGLLQTGNAEHARGRRRRLVEDRELAQHEALGGQRLAQRAPGEALRRGATSRTATMRRSRPAASPRPAQAAPAAPAAPRAPATGLARPRSPSMLRARRLHILRARRSAGSAGGSVRGSAVTLRRRGDRRASAGGRIGSVASSPTSTAGSSPHPARGRAFAAAPGLARAALAAAARRRLARRRCARCRAPAAAGAAPTRQARQ